MKSQIATNTKAFIILLVFVTILSFTACSGNATTNTTEATAASVAPETTEEPTLAKEDMLALASPMKRDDISKSIENIAFEKSLVGNYYTFGGQIFSVAEDHAVVTFYIEDEQGTYGTTANVLVGNLYLPLDELISLEAKQRFLFVGKLDDVSTHDESIPDWGTQKVIDMQFHSCAIVGDRFERTGTLHSQNASYGPDAWNILPPGSSFSYVVHFRDDVSSYLGKTITFSYKHTSEGNIDAYIVE